MQYLSEHLLRGARGGKLFDMWNAFKSGELRRKARIGEEEKEKEEAGGGRGGQ